MCGGVKPSVHIMHRPGAAWDAACATTGPAGAAGTCASNAESQHRRSSSDSRSRQDSRCPRGWPGGPRGSGRVHSPSPQPAAGLRAQGWGQRGCCCCTARQATKGPATNQHWEAGQATSALTLDPRGSTGKEAAGKRGGGLVGATSRTCSIARPPAPYAPRRGQTPASWPPPPPNSFRHPAHPPTCAP